MEVDMRRALTDYIRLVATYTRLNLKAQLEYRGAFASQVAAMFVNDGMWVVFWMFFFTRFPVLRGWALVDVMTLWAVVAAGFGIAYGVMGNAHQLASLITHGELDLWLFLPRPVLPHLLVGRSIATAWGDAAFGYVVYFALVRPDLTHMALFVLLTFIVAVAFVGLGVMTGSLAFYMGNASALSEQWKFAVITFATYPPTLFDGVVKVLLFTVVPAAFVSYIPVETLRTLSAWHLLSAVGGALALLAGGVWMFYRGLRRYESGNLMLTNG
jgi:ABC-2 type transport system permease protein